jgi:hypothetical protein
VIELPHNASFFFLSSGLMVVWRYEYFGDGRIGVACAAEATPTPADREEHRDVIAAVLAWRGEGRVRFQGGLDHAT